MASALAAISFSNIPLTADVIVLDPGFLTPHQDPREHLKVIFQDEKHEELVLVRDVSFYSCCEHHLVPFFSLS